jgi:hypothetical protein
MLKGDQFPHLSKHPFSPAHAKRDLASASTPSVESLVNGTPLAYPTRDQNPVQSADTFFELSHFKNFVDSRNVMHANRKKTPQICSKWVSTYFQFSQSRLNLVVLGLNAFLSCFY